LFGTGYEHWTNEKQSRHEAVSQGTPCFSMEKVERADIYERTTYGKLNSKERIRQGAFVKIMRIINKITTIVVPALFLLGYCVYDALTIAEGFRRGDQDLRTVS
jgi:hypothetical protein